jgi:hypothetical protein
MLQSILSSPIHAQATYLVVNIFIAGNALALGGASLIAWLRKKGQDASSGEKEIDTGGWFLSFLAVLGFIDVAAFVVLALHGRM